MGICPMNKPSAAFILYSLSAAVANWTIEERFGGIFEVLYVSFRMKNEGEVKARTSPFRFILTASTVAILNGPADSRRKILTPAV